jgi:hypothetical protein
MSCKDRSITAGTSHKVHCKQLLSLRPRKVLSDTESLSLMSHLDCPLLSSIRHMVMSGAVYWRYTGTTRLLASVSQPTICLHYTQDKEG